MPSSPKRVLAAIMFTDIKGYTALMQENEEKAISIRKRHRGVFRETTARYNGEILQYYGDGTLSIFFSSVDAVLCGIDMQRRLLEEPVLPVRIAIHTGDIIYNEEEIIGDSVNVASRLESIGVPGSLLISEKVFHDIKNQNKIENHFIGNVLFKNVSEPMGVYSITNNPLKVPTLDELGVKGRIKPKTIAVLPFVNFSNDGDDYFSEGITEEILNVLAKKVGLQVTSRTSSFFFKDKNVGIKEIGELLRVGYILEGSIRWSGKRVRIAVQLIQVDNDSHRWSERYDRDVDDVFEIQDEIAREIGKQLGRELGLKQKALVPRRKVNTEAHNLYLKGRYHFNRWTPDSVKESISCFKEAINLVPDYAEAYAGLAGSYVFLGITGYDQEGYSLGIEASEKAFSLNPNNEDCVLAKAMIDSLFLKKKSAPTELFNRAIQINPDYATAHQYYAMHLAHIGKLKQSLAAYQRASILDPLSLPINAEYAKALAIVGEHDKALKHINKTIKLDPFFRSAWEAKGWIYFLINDLERSLECFIEYQRLTHSADKGLTGLAIVNAAIGNRNKAEEYLQLMIERKQSSPELSIDLDLAMVYLGLDKIEESLDYMEAAMANKQGSIFFNTMPYFRKLEGHTRFEILKKKYLPKD